jgi:hypothetical protein
MMSSINDPSLALPTFRRPRPIMSRFGLLGQVSEDNRDHPVMHPWREPTAGKSFALRGPVLFI